VEPAALNRGGGILATSFIAQQAPQADACDFDGDVNTDQYVLIASADPGGPRNCGKSGSMKVAG